MGNELRKVILMVLLVVRIREPWNSYSFFVRLAPLECFTTDPDQSTLYNQSFGMPGHF